MNSLMSEMPGPAVAVKARAPFQPAPTTMPMEASSSSAWMMANLFLPVSLSTRSFEQERWKASASDEDGVIGYQAQTVAPPYRHPKAAAALPSMKNLSPTALALVRGLIATSGSPPPRRPRWPFSVRRTSYQVGRPWMFDGKMLRGETGMPMRRKLFANSSLAEAEPEPLTLANLMTKSLTASILFIALGGLLLPVAAAAGAGVGHLEQELLHVPGAGRAALGAQAAVQADVLVLHHHAAGLERPRDVEVLRQVFCGRIQMVSQFFFICIAGERDAVHRADVDAGIALDAQPVGEHRLHVAVEAALRLLPRRGDVEAELDLGLDVLQRDLDVAPGHLVAHVGVDLVVVAPLVDAHLLRHQADARGGPFRDILAIEQLVDGHGRVVAMRHGPDDVLRAEGGVAAEEHVRRRRLHGHLVHHGHV